VKAEVDALEKPRQPGRVRAIVLAVAVHAAFFALIVFGVTWQSRPEAPLEAELWDKLPAKVTAAPKADPGPARPDPPKPELKPEPPKPEPPKPEPTAKPEPPRPDPAIAEKKERQEREKRERLEKQRQDEARKAREKDEAEKKRKQEAKAKAERDKELAESAKAQEAANAAKRTEFNRYVDGIRNKIRGKANVPDNVSGRPSVQVRITILPGGDVLNVLVVKSSGNPAYDSAIERAIRSAQPLPVPAPDSELFPQFRDLILNIEHDR